MKYVDIHTHKQNIPTDVLAVQNLSFDDAEQIIALENDILFSVGIHPWHIGSTTPALFRRLEIICLNQYAVLIGECGLDKNTEYPFETQSDIFRRHVLLSEELQKPLIIHCVGYFNEIMELKKQYAPRQKWIIHGFRGKPQLAAQLLRAGFDLSFGPVFNPESVKITPNERLFIETDDSDIPIGDVYKSIAVIKMCNTTDLRAGTDLIHC